MVVERAFCDVLVDVFFDFLFFSFDFLGRTWVAGTRFGVDVVLCLMFPGVLLEVRSSAFARFFVSAFLVNHGGGASSFGCHGAELSLGGRVSCRVGGVA